MVAGMASTSRKSIVLWRGRKRMRRILKRMQVSLVRSERTEFSMSEFGATVTAPIQKVVGQRLTTGNDEVV